MITELLVPFQYDYMFKAMWVSALVAGVCAFLSGLPDAERLVADGRCDGALRGTRAWHWPTR